METHADEQGTTMTPRFASVTPSAFLSSIKDQLGEKSTPTLAQTYSITRTMDQNLFLTCFARWIGDVLFDAPTHLLATHLSSNPTKKIYRYIFDVRNPFPNNALYQQPHHWVDIYFVFKAHQFRFPSHRLKHISTRHSQLWVEFANGKEPWTAYKDAEEGKATLMVADERAGWVERSVVRVEEDLEWGYGRCEGLVESWREGGMEGRRWDALGLECLRGVKKT